ncbi:MAG: hypothetical protein ACTSSE_12630 [Candidatus Thorarchaeota archaeon]
MKKRTTRGPGKTKFLKEGGVEVNESNKVTIAKTRVELESKKDKESGERECDRATMTGSDVQTETESGELWPHHVMRSKS